MKIETKRLFITALLATGIHCFSQQKANYPAKESFENATSIANFKKNNSSTLTISKTHHQFGESSLQWEWSGESFFKTSTIKILNKKESSLLYGDFFPASPTLVMSIYNEKAQSEEIKIAFEKEGKDIVWFPIKLDFTGWRTIRVPFFEMSGNPPAKNMDFVYDTFKVSCNATKSKGKLYFDDIVFSQYMDDRFPYPDVMVPIIKRDLEVGSDHWMPLIRDLKRTQNIKLQPVSEAQKKEIAIIEKRIDDTFDKNTAKKDNLAEAKKEYAKLNLVVKETVLGPPLTFKLPEIYFDKEDANQKISIDVLDYGKIIKKLANFYLQSTDKNKAEIEEMFLNATRYFLDQGWQEGASGGTRHHIGYALKEVTDAFYMMKQPLKKAGLLDPAGASLQWIFNLGKVLGPDTEFESNIDYYNTQSYYHLMLIFMMDNVEKQAALLTTYSNYISKTLAQENEIGVFKVDGTSWHHNGHYPAYGMGAFRSLPSVFFSLSGTQFRISEAGHANFKKAFMTTRLYSQLYDFGFGISGRHPLDDSNTINSLKTPFLLMARSGNPEGTSEIDKDVAAAYLRLWGKSDKLNSALFKDKYQIEEEKLPGYKVLPYAAFAVHRRNDWAAFIKGYSKYVWASEIYVDENRYGRYPSNGSIQINYSGGSEASGFKQEGWDWNRYPGTTIIHLPLNELEPQIPLLMFKSTETFAGSVTLNDNGVFGMKLNESKGENADGNEKNLGFPGKLKANKSVFSFGEKLICIGTGISSVDTVNSTETNLFQNALTTTSMPIFSSEMKTISTFPYQASMEIVGQSKKWIIDAYHNGYYILTPNTIQIRRQSQESYYNEYSINTGKKHSDKSLTNTKGDFATSWIEHGKAPKDASYQYVIYPGLQQKDIDSFDQKVKNDNSYEILRADNVAHIVKDKETSTTGFVIFDATAALDNDILKSVSVPSLLMIKNETKNLTISAVQPDLNFEKSEGKSISGYSMPVELTITLKGTWKLNPDSTAKSISVSGGNTIITVECRHGYSNKINIVKQ